MNIPLPRHGRKQTKSHIIDPSITILKAEMSDFKLYIVVFYESMGIVIAGIHSRSFILFNFI